MRARLTRRPRQLVTMLVAASLALAACGSDSSTGDSSTPAAPAASGASAGADSSAPAAESGSAGSGSAGSGSAGAPAESAQGVDDGTTLTLWTRAPLEKQAKALVEAYNASHQNQVELTIVPNDDYVAKVGAAAGAGNLPDLFAADIVYVQNWASQGLFADLTDKIGGLPYADTLNPGHLAAGTVDERKYVLPFVLDLSVMMYNKTLYKEAGLDPEKGPTTLAEYAEHAKKIQALNKEGVNGTFFGANCGGCLVFTWFPMIWASGSEVISEDGRSALMNSEPAKQVYSTYRDLIGAGAVAPGYQEETGATWVGAFQEGKIGVMPYPATLLSTADEKVDVGLVGLPGVDGGESTFVGGDGVGISKDSQKADQAWNFLAWLTSEAAQVEVLAKGGDAVSRSDLAENTYAAKDPRVVLVNQLAAKGKTPIAPNFQAAFNAPDGPWLTLIRNAVLGDGSSIDADNDAITAVLQEGS